MEKKILFNLFENSDICCYGAIENAKLIKKIYPEWKGVFYVVDDIDLAIVNAIMLSGCDICFINKSVNNDCNEYIRLFHQLSNLNVKYILIRDVINRISKKEADAVNEWIKSETVFHIIRDHDKHIYPITNNFFGINCDKFRNLLNNNTKINSNKTSFDFYLTNILWPLIKENYIAHNRCKMFNTLNDHTFTINDDICGVNYNEDNEPIQYQIKSFIKKKVIIFEHKKLTFTKELQIMQHFRIIFPTWQIIYLNNEMKEFMYIHLKQYRIQYIQIDKLFYSYFKFRLLLDQNIHYVLYNPEFIFDNDYDLDDIILNNNDTLICLNDEKSFLIINKNKLYNKSYDELIDNFNKTNDIKNFDVALKTFINNLHLDIKVLTNNYKCLKYDTLKDKKLSVIIISRNDDFIPDYKERCKICFDSMINAFDEVIYIDWNSPSGITLLDKLKTELINEGSNIIGWDKIKQIVITKEDVVKLNLKDAEECPQVIARNIGIRHATGDYIISTNIDIVVPTRDEFNKIKIYPNTFYTIGRIDFKCNLMYKLYNSGHSIKDIKNIKHDFISDYDDIVISHIFMNDIYPIKQSNKIIDIPDNINFDVINLMLQDDDIVEYYSFTDYDNNIQGKVINKYQTEIERNDYRKYPKILNCGDFQFGSKEIWFDIKGFEESMIHSLGSDNNIHVKVIKHKHNLVILSEPYIYHISHGKRSSHIQGNDLLKFNDFNTYIRNFKQTKNTDNWGCYI